MAAPASARPHRVWIAFLSAAVAALPPLIILGLIARVAVNVPFQDDWDAVSVLIRWHHGTVGLADFWEQQSEHRILAVRVMIWLLGILTDFNVIAEMLLGFGFVALTLVVVRALLETALKDVAPELVPPLTAVSSLLLFSLALQENWFFGTASVELLLYLASVMLIWALTRCSNRWRNLGIAVSCAVVGTLTEVSGVGLWFIGAVAIWLADDVKDLRIRRLTVWMFAALLTVGAYMRALNWSGSVLQASASQPHRFVVFVGATLGLPFGFGSSPTWSAVVGLGGCVVFGIAAFLIHRQRPIAFRGLLPITLLAIYGVLIAAMIGAGRSNLEMKFAMASHYASGPSLFWIATLTMAAVATRTAWETASRAARIAAAIIIACAATGLLYGYIAANVAGYREAYARSRNLEMALASLYSVDIGKDVSQFLYPPDDGRFHRQLVELKALQLGPFAKRMEPTKARLVEQFAGRTPTGGAEGFHDGGDCDRTFGWAWDPTRPAVPIMVDIWYRGARIGTATANWFRGDLRQTGIGDGQHAFLYFFPTILEVGTGEKITVTFAGTTKSVGGSPKVITCE